MHESLRRDLSLSANSVSQARVITNFRFAHASLTAPSAPLRQHCPNPRVSFLQPRLRSRSRCFCTPTRMPNFTTGCVCRFHVHGQFRLHFHRVFSACAARRACDPKHNPFPLLTSKSLCAAATSPSSTSAAAAPTRAPTPRSSWRAGARVCSAAHCSRRSVTFRPVQTRAA